MSESECVIWTKATLHGYGWQTKHGVTTFAHRHAYTDAYVEIPAGLVIHHVCENKLCVNPEHLRALTRADHRREHMSDTCPAGHAFTRENTYVTTTGARRCRTCYRAQKRAFDARRRLPCA